MTEIEIPAKQLIRVHRLYDLGEEAIAAGLLAENPRLITWARSRRGLTQTDLARELDCSQPTVCRWESGTRRPSRELARRALRFLMGVVQEAIAEDAEDDQGPLEAVN